MQSVEIGFSRKEISRLMIRAFEILGMFDDEQSKIENPYLFVFDRTKFETPTTAEIEEYWSNYADYN